MIDEQRGLWCDVCGRRFAGDPGETTVLWEKDTFRREAAPGPEVLFLHIGCITEAIDRAYVYCGGGAWSARQDQIDSVDHLLMQETLLYQDGKACERYREFCRSCPARKGEMAVYRELCASL
jgi:hypothetical protein